jgi:hypothetical protein
MEKQLDSRAAVFGSPYDDLTPRAVGRALGGRSTRVRVLFARLCSAPGAVNGYSGGGVAPSFVEHLELRSCEVRQDPGEVDAEALDRDILALLRLHPGVLSVTVFVHDEVIARYARG